MLAGLVPPVYQEDASYVEMSGVFKTVEGGKGSIILRMDVLEDATLSLVFDGAAKDLQLVTGIPKDFEASNAISTPREVHWRVLMHPRRQTIRLETWEGGEWSPTSVLHAPVPKLRGWIEANHGAVVAGVAHASIENYVVRMVKHPVATIFLIR